MSNRPILFAVVSALAAMMPSATLGADELPPRAIARIGDHRFYHGPGITCAVLSPDGRYVASAAAFPSYFRYVTDKDRDPYQRTVVLWESATGERVREFRAPGGPVWHLAFAPDGKRLAAVGRFGVALFDVETGLHLRTLGDKRPWGRPQFSADGTELRIAEFRGTLTAWEVSSGKRLRRWDPPVGPSEWVKEREHVHVVVPSPDGKVIAWLLWQAPDYSKLPPGAFPPPPIMIPTALVVADAATGKPLYRREFEPGALDSFAFSADTRRFLTAGDKVRAWDTATGKEQLAVEEPRAYRFALSPDGRRAVVEDGNSRVRLWDLETGKPSHELTSGRTYLNSHTLESPQAFSADGKTLVLATDSTLRLFDTATSKEKATPAHRTSIAPRFSADGRTLVTTCDETRCRWDLSGKEPALRLCEPRHPR
jgi:WD40 repeat protein